MFWRTVSQTDTFTSHVIMHRTEEIYSHPKNPISQDFHFIAQCDGGFKWINTETSSAAFVCRARCFRRLISLVGLSVGELLQPRIEGKSYSTLVIERRRFWPINASGNLKQIQVITCMHKCLFSFGIITSFTFQYVLFIFRWVPIFSILWKCNVFWVRRRVM